MSRRSRNKRKYRAPERPHEPRATEATERPKLNLDFLKAATVVLPEWETVQLVLAGCGGIGAYVAQHVGRLMRVIYDSGRGVNLTLCDPDRVEQKNLGRQLFCDAEIGEWKAIALARRYGAAWGLNTVAYHEEFNESVIMGESDLVVVVGCVDNAKARAALHDVLSHNPQESHMGPPRAWWLDCGNLKDTGRVMLGSAYEAEQCEAAFSHDRKRVGALPSPGLQRPDLLIPGRDEASPRELSCAEMQMMNLQSLNINAAIAVQAADMLTRLLVTNDLKRYQCAVNLASGTVKSFFCTPEEIARELGRSPEFLVSVGSCGHEQREAEAA